MTLTDINSDPELTVIECEATEACADLSSGEDVCQLSRQING